MSRGPEGNGLEDWRELFSAYQGSGALVRMAGWATRLDVEQCKSTRHPTITSTNGGACPRHMGVTWGRGAQPQFRRINQDNPEANISRRLDLKNLDILRRRG